MIKCYICQDLLYDPRERYEVSFDGEFVWNLCEHHYLQVLEQFKQYMTNRMECYH